MKKDKAIAKNANMFERISAAVINFSGSTPALLGAFSLIIVWLMSGPLFNFSNDWQLIPNTAVTMVTFAMVFLIQRSQNKVSLAIQLKLNEIVGALEGANNNLIAVEDLTEEELDVLYKHYQRLAATAKKDRDIRKSYSVEVDENLGKADT